MNHATLKLRMTRKLQFFMMLMMVGMGICNEQVFAKESTQSKKNTTFLKDTPGKSCICGQHCSGLSIEQCTAKAGGVPCCGRNKYISIIKNCAPQC